ncbi:hypothetical protein L873DRAFT_1782960 [Choiromyces venosus 120613-1]|uniref:Mitochondrial zinc maintenance protein 1, mitochondrial n=1 Tax=Choiromyces venosus 120613-1 TaxID=1336337 RepID=A0A3N4IVS2_9PEZI|nr:hypothetical protein L873DRAFT_1782960 [Choiromyces venosus 120613-1]
MPQPSTPPQAYLTLLRAARLAFAGDTKTLSAARARIRREFRHTPSTQREREAGLQKALDAAKILRENVVQGEFRADRGVFRLRMHDEIERGDNGSVRLPRGVGGSAGGGCCRK